MRSEQGKSSAAFLGLLLGLSLASVAAGQAPPSPAPVPTIWDKLGVTGFHNCLESKLVNPHGNHPGLEKKPLLKKIADPANLQSDNPAIKAAAQVKQQEDLAPQKIKAIKYLATMGCGCYQKTVNVREHTAGRAGRLHRRSPLRGCHGAVPGGGQPVCAVRRNVLQRGDDEQAPGARQRQERQRLLQRVFGARATNVAVRVGCLPAEAAAGLCRDATHYRRPNRRAPDIAACSQRRAPLGPAGVAGAGPAARAAADSRAGHGAKEAAGGPGRATQGIGRGALRPTPTASSVVILDVKPVVYDAGKARPVAARNDRAAKPTPTLPQVVLRLVIPAAQ